MSETQSNHSRVQEYLRRLAPNSIVDIGLDYAARGLVTECSKDGRKILGTFRDESDQNHSIRIDILSGKTLDAGCSCSTREEMLEQWCPHAIAVLWRATDLDFFDPNNGFASVESAFRMNTSSPQEIAEALDELREAPRVALRRLKPEVAIAVDTETDRLGVSVHFDGEEQEPLLFDDKGDRSSRALDNLLLRYLDDNANWDEDTKRWYVNSSDDLVVVLGLLEEYQNVVSCVDQSPILFPKELLQAELQIQWLEEGAELVMKWVLPDGAKVEKESEILGTGPYWTCINNSLYRLSTEAARIASIFPYASMINLSRSQIGPILEVLTRNEGVLPYTAIRNPEDQPESVVKQPIPHLELTRRQDSVDHFAPSSSLEIIASLEFRYPSPPSKENVVYLPDRDREEQLIGELVQAGFQREGSRRRYSIQGDAALDLVHSKELPLSADWNVEGLDSVRKDVKFSELSLNVAVSSAKQEEKTAAAQGRIDWFDCHVSLTQNNANIPISTLFKNLKGQHDRWLRLDSGAFAKVPGGSLKRLQTTLGLLEPNFRLSNNIKTKLNTAQALGISRIEDRGLHLSLDSHIQRLAAKLRNFESVEQVKIPKKFEGELRSYQHEGLSWLNFLNDFDLGGILADEMGLGKTVQALALLQHLKEQRKAEKQLKKPALIVAPTSVVTNWHYEARRFVPQLKVLMLHGPKRKEDFYKIEEYDLVLTSYALLRIDRTELEKIDFSYVILDEAQNIKNPLAATSRAAKALKAESRLALTGTPTENRPLELWSIFDFLMPGYLGSVEFFRSHFEKPIMDQGTDADSASVLRAKTRPFVLRRTKAEVEKDLPEKVESELHVEMTQSQRELYASVLAEVRPQVEEAVEKRGIRGASVSILAALLRLRQVCNHPESIQMLAGRGKYDSGKFNLLKDLVSEALESNRKILVFSQFLEMLAIIRRWLGEKDVNHLYLDGSTKNRQELIDRFNADDNVRLFLISLKAGGTGLNLTAADTVIIYDPWWNPAVESQAVDRAHRIGQTKAVSVYRLVTEDSIEQKIMSLKTRKEQIVDCLINENAMSPLKLTKAELDQLFEL